MRRKLRMWVANSLAVIVLVSGALVTPGTVLCIGPGHHCHLENPIGDSCSTPLPAPNRPATNVPDGCPRGSRDITLSVPARSTDNGIAALFCPPLTVAAAYIATCTLSRAEPSFVGAARAAAPQRSTTILRC